MITRRFALRPRHLLIAGAAATSLLEDAAREYLARAKALGAGPDRAIQVVEIVSRRH